MATACLNRLGNSIRRNLMKGFTTKQIETHFIINPDWKEVYFNHYTSATEDDYVQNAKKLFEQNSYSFEFKRMNNNPNSTFYCVGEAILKKDGEELFCMNNHESDWVEQLLVNTISDYTLIDFSTFK